ncbi:hypothetical protein [Phenylobacterium sp.]|uniref:hypothetical protein n=1 Tax=Phenylobacterium sp. TaxID=1871053 RepID=UPI001614395C
MAIGSPIVLVRPWKRGRVARTKLAFGGCKSRVALDVCLPRLRDIGYAHHPMIAFVAGSFADRAVQHSTIFRLSGREVRQASRFGFGMTARPLDWPDITGAGFA